MRALYQNRQSSILLLREVLSRTMHSKFSVQLSSVWQKLSKVGKMPKKFLYSRSRFWMMFSLRMNT